MERKGARVLLRVIGLNVARNGICDREALGGSERANLLLELLFRA